MAATGQARPPKIRALCIATATRPEKSSSRPAGFDPKDFRQRWPTGMAGRYSVHSAIHGACYTTCRNCLGARMDATVFVVEGEKDAETRSKLGVVATCNVLGAGKWLPEYADLLVGRSVAVIPDRDPDGTGQRHAEAVCASLTGRAAACSILELPGMPTTRATGLPPAARGSNCSTWPPRR